MGPWQHKGEVFDVSYAEVLRNNWFGFIYLIDNRRTGRRYLGKKCFHCFRKGRKLEAAWKQYWGSNTGLTDDVISLGADSFCRTILSFHGTPQDLAYEEVRQMFLHDVLRAKLLDGSPAFYNSSIPSIAFQRPITV